MDEIINITLYHFMKRSLNGGPDILIIIISPNSLLGLGNSKF